MKIAINPGHDVNLDPGACGQYLHEADVTDAVARLVIKELENKGIETYYIQSNELWEISSMATATGADMFVSIHCNSATSSQAHGTETFYYTDDASEQLAECIQQNVVEILDTTDRGTKNGNWIAVLNSTELPATVLVELAFISNPEEEMLLYNRQQDCADGIVAGIMQYITNMELMEE